MLFASAITRCLRARISVERGPGSSVRRSIVGAICVLSPAAAAAAGKLQEDTQSAGRLPAHTLRPMVLSDQSIREEIAAGRIVVDLFVDAMVQPCSIDVTVGNSFRVFRNSRYPYIDVKREMEDLTELVRVGPDEPFILHPGEFVLGVVAERVALPDDIVATLDGKSSLGRLGLVVHQTAGVIDAGFDGHITLELANMANLPITVYPGMRIAQLSFLTLSTPADHPYGSSKLGSKYQGQAEPTPSRYYLNFAERP